jgi:small subunit ribosomal protein S24e
MKMEISIEGKKENALLSRVELEFRLSHVAEPTPKRDQVREELAKQLKVTKDRVVVDHMQSSFGKGESVGYAKIYKSKDEALRVESDYILIRNGLAQKKAKQEAKKEA